MQTIACPCIGPKQRPGLIATLALGVSLIAAPAMAQEEWEFVVTPLFIWAKNLEGTSAMGGNDLPLDLDFQDDILENLDASFSIRAEATRGRLSYFAEYNFARLEPTSTATLGPITFNADVEYDDVMAEAGIAWALADAGPTTWEVLAGVRYFDQDVTVDISRQPLGPGVPTPSQIRGGDSWWHGMLGLRYTRSLGERWSLRLRSDLGYGGSQNSALHALGLVNYRFKDWGSAFVGYRFLSVDYDNEENGAASFAYDVEQQGPILGFNFHF